MLCHVEIMTKSFSMVSTSWNNHIASTTFEFMMFLPPLWLPILSTMKRSVSWYQRNTKRSPYQDSKPWTPKPKEFLYHFELYRKYFHDLNFLYYLEITILCLNINLFSIVVCLFWLLLVWDTYIAIQKYLE